ncbi:MAG: ABC transporter permease [Candidatus Promineifilaceae bacterium]|nr:ABC transporter permease [Candidatus Promineifilaceae bacterium]
MRSVDIETETPAAVQEPLVQRPAWRRYLRWIAVAILIILALVFRQPLITWVAETSWNVWLGAVAQGLGFGAVALGVYLTFRVLDFPDLTIDGSFPMGAAVASALILNGYDVYATLPLAFLAGALAGTATGLIHTYLKINGLLASILVLTGAFTINLRIMGQSNIPLLNEETIFSPYRPFFRELFIERWDNAWVRVHSNIMAIVVFLVIIVVLKLALDWFLHTELGLSVRATGDNPQMIRALGVNTERMKILGLALSNGMVGLSGALLAQYQGFADVNSGAGLIIAGLAAVIIGETLFGRKTVARATAAVVLGMIVYRLAIAAALTINIPIPGRDAPFRMEATDVKLATALLVLVALAIPRIQQLRRRDG